MPVLGKNLSKVPVIFLQASYKYTLINRLIKVNKHINSALLSSLAPKGLGAPLSEASPEVWFWDSQIGSREETILWWVSAPVPRLKHVLLTLGIMFWFWQAKLVLSFVFSKYLMKWQDLLTCCLCSLAQEADQLYTLLHIRDDDIVNHLCDRPFFWSFYFSTRLELQHPKLNLLEPRLKPAVY